VWRKGCKFICLPICFSLGRYRPLGKSQSHLQGCAPRRYQNKANLHARRSAKQLQYLGSYRNWRRLNVQVLFRKGAGKTWLRWRARSLFKRPKWKYIHYTTCRNRRWLQQEWHILHEELIQLHQCLQQLNQ
jgi:hypothetical protein